MKDLDKYQDDPNPWLKTKGYLHLTPQIDVVKNEKKLLGIIKNPNFIARYGFYPLLHSIIEDRKYKKTKQSSTKRCHSYYDREKNKHERTAKKRPLHYSTHMDALIFGYYAKLIQDKYDLELGKDKKLDDSIIAYRKKLISENNSDKKGKGTIHFAQEVFEEIKNRCKIDGDCAVLAFDIKGFFPSLDHAVLKDAWCKLFDFDKLPSDHFNVFKAATRFSYIMLDDFKSYKKGKKGFDEKNLARIRNEFGVQALFESPKAFREAVKNGEVKIHRYPFRNADKCPIGIPQGLPISAVLANIYLLGFDMKILESLINLQDCFYRRYSDDIIVVCPIKQMEHVEEFVTKAIVDRKVKISEDKTEKFIFRTQLFHGKERLLSVKIVNGKEKVGLPLIYLGFQFSGFNVLIKSTNLAKFYRRMIYAVKRKAKRAKKVAELSPENKPIIFTKQLYRLCSSVHLKNINIHSSRKRLVRTQFGNFKLKITPKEKSLKSNYFSYVEIASKIMNEPAIKKQLRNHKKVFNQAIKKHLK